jgi:predicted alpha/beta superfamily hydrolase
VRSAHLGNERPIYVWLPLSYHESGDRTYPVLYMQDEMSPALWFNDCALLELIERAPFVEGRIYLDMGTAEGDEHVKPGASQFRRYGLTVQASTAARSATRSRAPGTMFAAWAICTRSR